jgi:hypothetical protein
MPKRAVMEPACSPEFWSRWSILISSEKMERDQLHFKVDANDHTSVIANRLPRFASHGHT